MKMSVLTVCLLLLSRALAEDYFEETVSMPIFNVTEPDTYLCYAVPVEELRPGSIVGFKVHSAVNIAHHVSLAVCKDYDSKEDFWDCREQQGNICLDRIVSLGGKEGFQNEYAETDYPKDIGVELGDSTGLKYVIMQVHYKNPSSAQDLQYSTVNITLKMTSERRPYIMQKVVLVSLGHIPARSVFSSEVALQWKGDTVRAVSFFVHTHNYGLMAEGYIIKGDQILVVGRKKITAHANPEYDVEKPFTIEHGDIIAARCIYQNNETFPVEFGVRNQDEMCNFGIIFKYHPSAAVTYPRAIVQYQSAQNSTWCSNVIPGANVLCEKSKDVLQFKL